MVLWRAVMLCGFLAGVQCCCVGVAVLWGCLDMYAWVCSSAVDAVTSHAAVTKVGHEGDW